MVPNTSDVAKELSHPGVTDKYYVKSRFDAFSLKSGKYPKINSTNI